MRRTGISLLELLMTVALLAVTLGATMNAYLAGLNLESRFASERDCQDEIVRFEDDLTSMIQAADLSDGNSVFVSPIAGTDSTSQTSNSSGVLPAGSGSLILTTWNQPPTNSYLQQTQSSWETLNSRYGPQGSTDEFAFSMTPVGDAGNSHGLFVREQRPPQPDVTQGGTERIYSNKIRDIRFEFYDGTNWVTTWDSRKGDEKGKLPTCVRVTYIRIDEQNPRTFLVRLRLVPNLPQGGSS